MLRLEKTSLSARNKEDDIMAFENTQLFDQLATDALEKYGWQDTDESKLIVLSENATYMVKNKET